MKKIKILIALSLLAIISACSAEGTSNKNASVLGLTAEQSDAVVGVLNSVGLSEGLKIEHDELLDGANEDGEKGYRVKAEDVSNVILYVNSSGEVNQVKYADSLLYENGKVVSKIIDYIVPFSERSDLQIRSQNVISDLLKSPSTAKFPNLQEWRFGKQDGVTIIQGYVDAQNSFGATTRSDFQLKVQEDKVISLIFEGKEYMQ